MSILGGGMRSTECFLVLLPFGIIFDTFFENYVHNVTVVWSMSFVVVHVLTFN